MEVHCEVKPPEPANRSKEDYEDKPRECLDGLPPKHPLSLPSLREPVEEINTPHGEVESSNCEVEVRLHRHHLELLVEARLCHQARFFYMTRYTILKL